MKALVARILVVALGLWLASQVVHGVEIHGIKTLILATLLLGIANAVVRPVIVMITLPITLVTLGLFILVINAALFWLVSVFLHGFKVHGVVAAFEGSLLVSVVSWFASAFIGKRGWLNRGSKRRAKQRRRERAWARA